MPPIPPRGVTRNFPDPRFDAHLAPTLSDLPLDPRRRLRDGTASASANGGSSRARRGSSSSRGSRAVSIPRGTKRSRSRTADSDVATNAAESSRRLPPLQPRTGRRRVDSADGDSSDDEPLSWRASRGSVNDATIPHRSHSTPQPRAPSRDPQPGVTGTTPPRRDSAASVPNLHQPSVSREPSPSVSSTSSGPRRYTAQEKGKGRAMPSPSPADPDILVISDDEEFDESVQFIARVPPPPIDITQDDEADEAEVVEEITAIDEDSAISAFTCPVCFMPPTAPALTPCGHIMCYTCLHQSMLAAISRQTNPWPNNRPRAPTARGRGRGRPRRSAFTALAAGERYFPPKDKWTAETLEEAFAASQEDFTRRTLLASGDSFATVEQLMQYAKENENQEPKATAKQELVGLWKVGDKWVIEGECPVCRKDIPGGLGPLQYRLGSVVLLETRATHAGETQDPRAVTTAA